MSLWDAPKKLFGVKKADANDLLKHIGKIVTIPTFAVLEGERVKLAEDKMVIVTICMNRFKQNFIEINGTHLIGALRFFAQMENAKDITEDEMQAFEEMEMTAEKMPGTKIDIRDSGTPVKSIKDVKSEIYKGEGNGQDTTAGEPKAEAQETRH